MVDLTLTQLRGPKDPDLVLMLGPSLGTGVVDLWQRCAALLPATWQVVGWDLPGHGASRPATGTFTIDDLAASVRERGAALAAGRLLAYAGVSLGGAVGFTIAADPGPFGAVIALASAPKIGTPEAWHDRAAFVRKAGTSAMVEGSAARWFAPGFLEAHPDFGGRLLMALREIDDESYALACEALADYDVGDRMMSVTTALLIAGGAHDVVITPDEVAVVLDNVAHLPPAEDPAGTADLITTFLNQEFA